MIEIVSWGNKSTRLALEQFVKKAARFLDRGVHLLIIDIQPPGRCDPQGIHGAIWDYVAGKTYSAPIDKPLTVAAYESDAGVPRLRRAGRRGRFPPGDAAIPAAGPACEHPPGGHLSVHLAQSSRNVGRT